MDDKAKRILMLIDQFYPVVGGAEQQALRISEKLIKAGNKVLVLTRKSRDDLKDYEKYNGIEIFRLPFPGVSSGSKLKSSLPAVRWLIKNKEKYDIIHCHGVNPLEWGALFASFKTKKPYVIKIPLSNYLNYAGAKDGFKMDSLNKTPNTHKFNAEKAIRPMLLPALKMVRRKMIKNAGRIFAISPEIKNSLDANGIENVVDIPNGIDTDFYKPSTEKEKAILRTKLSLPTDHVIFVYSGRLAIEKNVETLIKAWDDFRKNYLNPRVRLLILGGGKDQTYSAEDRLKEYVISRDVTNVVFLGTVSNVLDYLQAADCFILPSFWEGMSNALLEAMACGLPSIVSDIEGNRALVDSEKSGLLFEPTDYIKLSEYINTIASDEILRKIMGQKAREITVEKYSLNRITKDILSEYDSVLGNKL